MVGAGDPLFRLRPELSGSAAAVDPRQTDPGRAPRHRRPARVDRRALFRALLLLHRDSGRLAGRSHPTGVARAVDRLRDVERGDDGLRALGHLSATRRRTDDGWHRRSRAASRPPTPSSPTTFRPACAARRSGLFNLGPPIGAALGIAFGASIAAAFSWRSAFVSLGAVGIVAAVVVWLFVREPVRGGFDAPSALERPAPTEGAVLGDAAACSSRDPVAAARVTRRRRDAVRHLRRRRTSRRSS